MNEAVIVSAVRTPLGSFNGSLAGIGATDLGAIVIQEAIKRAGIEKTEVNEVLMGQVLPCGYGQNPAKQASVKAGLPWEIEAITVNKVCGSALKTVMLAAQAIQTGDAEVVVAGGMESMTNAPYLLPGARGGLRMGNQSLIDSMVFDGLWDVYSDQHMGACAELCAGRYHFSREQQDAYAMRSYRRAQAAMHDGTFAGEIVAVDVPGRRGAVITVSEDEGPTKVDFDKVPGLRPAFDKDGTVTAANASTLNDGAAALVVTSEAIARERGMPVLAHIRGYSGHALEPEWFTVAPVEAMNKLFARLEWTPDSVDAYEINEAFSVVPMAAIEEFGLDEDRVNVLGGAVALGHPIGASGARILVTLLSALKRRGGRRGMASICIGGGEALAMGIEIA
jgi:acetyl-CoA C-acetyltransferase